MSSEAISKDTPGQESIDSSEQFHADINALRPGTHYAFTRNFEATTSRSPEPEDGSREMIPAGSVFYLSEIIRKANPRWSENANIPLILLHLTRSGDGGRTCEDKYVHLTSNDRNLFTAGLLVPNRRGPNNKLSPSRLDGEEVLFRAGDGPGKKLAITKKSMMDQIMGVRDKAKGILREGHEVEKPLAFKELKVGNVLICRRRSNEIMKGSRVKIIGLNESRKLSDDNREVRECTMVVRTLDEKEPKTASLIFDENGELKGFVFDERRNGTSLSAVSAVRAAKIIDTVNSADDYYPVQHGLFRRDETDTGLRDLIRAAVKVIQDAPEPPPEPQPSSRRTGEGWHRGH